MTTGVHIRLAKPGDIDVAFSRISDQSKNEIEAGGMSVESFKDEVSGKEAYVSENGNGILTFFGFNDFGNYVSMWSIGTVAFFSMGAPGVRETRRFFNNLDFRKTIVVTTTSPHPDVGRWLRLLGFSRQSRDGVAQVFTKL